MKKNLIDIEQKAVSDDRATKKFDKQLEKMASKLKQAQEKEVQKDPETVEKELREFLNDNIKDNKVQINFVK